ncbi:threonine synthase [Mobilicoccus caccae]|uniref:Threonine synthase n=1 Tax=Mobilicoccus caccae TaxID=1859295 RepID=A0ABQ6IMF0_9MICO|nr:threonine synthase [Mobilicoccus caccae]GMA38936.1 threonine synthase [Mobilicoccus caccae]
MRYLSTRDASGDASQRFCDILIGGLAPDGGLYLPESYPQVDDATLTSWRRLLEEKGYAALAHAILSLYIDDIDSEDLLGICRRAYTAEKFRTEDIVPVTRLDERLALGHLSNGPTAAFKDMAMQLLGELFEYELARRDQSLAVLGATSGDTGSSAIFALKGRARIHVFMLSPLGRMTPFQQAQMFSVDDPKVVNLAVDGVFDDCQDIVKKVASDLEFKELHRLGAVNSINWARLLAQVVYYVACWIRCTERNDQQVSFSVPTGNFGDVCAGHVAKQMGVPIDALVVATNENDVLDEFFRTGVYRVRRSAETQETSSPSMDISKASNFERFVFDLLGRDGARTAELFSGLGTGEGFDLSDVPALAQARSRYGFRSGRSTHADRVATIAAVDKEFGVVVDPHTADALKVAFDVLDGDDVATPVVVLETALPVKFAETIREALGHDPETPEAFAHLADAERHVTEIDNDADLVKKIIVETLT